ncbi:hypothetical protein ACFQ2B_11260 [Streptomyces stramineus]
MLHLTVRRSLKSPRRSLQPAKTVNRSPYAPLVTSPALSAQVVNLPSVVISTFRGAKVTPAGT